MGALWCQVYTVNVVQQVEGVAPATHKGSSGQGGVIESESTLLSDVQNE